MKTRIVWIMLICLTFFCGIANAGNRTYRQVKDVLVKENGKVIQSENKGNLFEYTYTVDTTKETITRTKIRRLDETTDHTDATVYKITKKINLWGSESGNGGKALVAIRKDGGEILELGHRFAFTMRISPFSQVITGIYKRVPGKNGKLPPHHPKIKQP